MLILQYETEIPRHLERQTPAVAGQNPRQKSLAAYGRLRFLHKALPISRAHAPLSW